VRPVTRVPRCALLDRHGHRCRAETPRTQVYGKARDRLTTSGDANDPVVFCNVRNNMKIIHQVPGRVRFRIPKLDDADYGNGVLAALKSEANINDASIRRACCSLTVRYDAAALTTKDIEALLDGVTAAHAAGGQKTLAKRPKKTGAAGKKTVAKTPAAPAQSAQTTSPADKKKTPQATATGAVEKKAAAKPAAAPRKKTDTHSTSAEQRLFDAVAKAGDTAGQKAAAKTKTAQLKRPKKKPVAKKKTVAKKTAPSRARKKKAAAATAARTGKDQPKSAAVLETGSGK
jgi:hypothetical protein